jgi:hypothetical protein
MSGPITKPEGKSYDTTDQMMCEVLLMAGYVATKITSTGYGSLVYSFNLDEVWPVVENILTGGASKMTFTFSDWWRARTTWKMNLRHHQTSMEDRGKHER